MKTIVTTSVQTTIMDAETGKPVKINPPVKNLMLQQGLNALAGDNSQGLKCLPATIATYAQVGSGNIPNKIVSGAVQFTQSGTALTASGGFFTSTMVGGIFKWGITGASGAEYYITAYTDSTHVTVDTSATVSTPDYGVVWQVQQTGLQTPLFVTNTYQTNSGDCGTTATATDVTFQRTYIIPVQGSPYTVNEIGYSPVSGNTKCCGRVVLSSSDVIGTSNYYVIVIAVTFTLNPNVPTSVSNVGTNFNSSGTAMIETNSDSIWQRVNSTGGLTATTGIFDCTTSVTVLAIIGSYAQNSTPQATPLSLPSNYASGTGSWTYQAGTVGIMEFGGNVTTSVSAGNLYGTGLKNYSGTVGLCFDIHFASPQAYSAGTLNFTGVFRIAYGRVLSN